MWFAAADEDYIRAGAELIITNAHIAALANAFAD